MSHLGMFVTVTCGPGTGLFIPLHSSDTRITTTDIGLDDTHTPVCSITATSRRHFYVTSLSDTTILCSRGPLWISAMRTPRRLSRHLLIRTGNTDTTVTVRARPRRLSWRIPAPRRFAWMYLFSLPWLLLMPAMLLRIIPGISYHRRMILLIVIYLLIASIVLTVIIVRRIRYRRPTPLTLSLLAASYTPTSTDPPPQFAAYTHRRHLIRASPGDTLCFAGPTALATMWWWVFQVVYHPKNSVTCRIVTDATEIIFGNEGDSPNLVVNLSAHQSTVSQAVTVCARDTLADSPLWADRVIATKRQALPFSPWWMSLVRHTLRPHWASSTLADRVLFHHHLSSILHADTLPAPNTSTDVSTAVPYSGVLVTQPDIPPTHDTRQLLAHLPSARATPRHVPDPPDLQLCLSDPLSASHAFIHAITQTWSRCDSEATPTAFLGVTASGPCRLNLSHVGPHTLIAGTTGSGKSEAVSTWLLSLALRYSPSRCQMVLVDYKGGAAFGPLMTLPHVAGVLTDLHPHMVTRALGSIRAELTRRERIAAADRDNGTNNAASLPWLFVVVDEFQALVSSHPDIMDELIHLATLGRSLGMFLIIATQRPAGIVDGHIRSNMACRLCLRVREGADSIDVIGTDKAAHLPAIPGRAYIQSDETQAVQVAWLADYLEPFVTAINQAGVCWSQPVAMPPWPPALPTDLPIAQIDHAVAVACRPDDSHPPDPITTGTIVLGVVDVAQFQRLEKFRTDLFTHMLIIGGPSSGKTTATHTAAIQWHNAEWNVHYIGSQAPACPVTTWVSTNIQLAARLCEYFAHSSDSRGEVLIIDDCDGLADDLNDTYGPLYAEELFTDLARQMSHHNNSLIMSGDAYFLSRQWASGFGKRLVLPLRDATDGAYLGLDTRTDLPEAIAGRATLIDSNTKSTVQLALPYGTLSAPDPPQLGTYSPLCDRQPAVRDLPTQCILPRTYLGLAGDQAEPYPISQEKLWLVVGSARSGKTNTVTVLSSAFPDAHIFDDIDTHPPAATEDLTESTVIASVDVDALLNSFDPVIQMLKSKGVLVILGQACTHRALVPLKMQTLAPLDTRIPGRGIINKHGNFHNIQVRKSLENSQKVHQFTN